GGDKEGQEARVARAPSKGLAERRNPRLQDEGIGHQREQGREVREREESINSTRRKSPREPGLYQRPGRRKQEVGQAYGRAQQAEDAPGRLFVAGRLPCRIGENR